MGLTRQVFSLLQGIDVVSGQSLAVSDASRVIDECVVAHRLESCGDVWQKHLFDAVELKNVSISTAKTSIDVCATLTPGVMMTVGERPFAT